jgi:hypothetical protein
LISQTLQINASVKITGVLTTIVTSSHDMSLRVLRRATLQKMILTATNSRKYRERLIVLRPSSFKCAGMFRLHQG